MNRSTVWRVLAGALAVGGLVAALAGRQQAVSLRVWLAACGSWLAIGVLRRTFAALPPVSPQLRPFLTRPGGGPTPVAPTVRDVRTLESLIARAQHNERTYIQQLRPRLVALTNHHLAVGHGIAAHTHPDRVAAVLGPVRWIVQEPPSAASPTPTPKSESNANRPVRSEPAHGDRSSGRIPTVPEIHELLDRLEVPPTEEPPMGVPPMEEPPLGVPPLEEPPLGVPPMEEPPLGVPPMGEHTAMEPAGGAGLPGPSSLPEGSDFGPPGPSSR